MGGLHAVKIFAFVLLAFAYFRLPSNADILVTVDEYGNGLINSTPIQGYFSRDPGPGSHFSVLTYNLPFPGTQGDVLFSGEPGLVYGGDVIRFNGNGTVIFYSDNIPTADAPADTVGPPFPYTNTATVQEIGPEGNNGAFYTPQPGQPGYNPATPTSYRFVSDGVVPEPSTFCLLALVIACVGLQRLRIFAGHHRV